MKDKEIVAKWNEFLMEKESKGEPGYCDYGDYFIGSVEELKRELRPCFVETDKWFISPESGGVGFKSSNNLYRLIQNEDFLEDFINENEIELIKMWNKFIKKEGYYDLEIQPMKDDKGVYTLPFMNDSWYLDNSYNIGESSVDAMDLIESLDEDLAEEFKKKYNIKE